MTLTTNTRVADNIRLLSAWIPAQLAHKRIPAVSIGIVYDQELVWAQGFGMADMAAKTPATATTIYRIASITKLFTATAIMQLRDIEGMSYQEIGNVLDLSLSQVKISLFRARKKLKTLLVTTQAYEK